MCRLEVATQRDCLEEQFCFASTCFLFVACVVCFHCQILLCHSLTAGLHLVINGFDLLCETNSSFVVACMTGAFPSQFLLANEQNGGLERESRKGTRVGR